MYVERYVSQLLASVLIVCFNNKWFCESDFELNTYWKWLRIKQLLKGLSLKLSLTIRNSGHAPIY